MNRPPSLAPLPIERLRCSIPRRWLAAATLWVSACVSIAWAVFPGSAVVYSPQWQVISGTPPLAGNYVVYVTSPVGSTYPVNVTVQVIASTYPMGDEATALSYVHVTPQTLSFSGPGQTVPMQVSIAMPTTALSSGVPAGTYHYGIVTYDWPIRVFGSAELDVQLASAPPISDTSTPVLTQQPWSSASIEIGDPLTFSVSAIGPGPQTFQWQFGGIDIPGATNATLSLGNLQEVQTGPYAAVVTNSFGTVTSNSTNVSLVPPAIVQSPVNATVSPGDPATFSVQASGTGTLSYQWLLNGQVIPGATSSTYSITSAMSTDAGAYAAVVANSGGAVTSIPATLTVALQPPTIVQQPLSQTVNVGTTVAMAVQASGSSPLSYQWSRNGSAIAGATSSNYLITSATLADAGDYSVAVSNAVGSVTSAIVTLTIAAPPAISAQPQDQSVPLGGTAEFSVGADGTAPLRFQWAKNGSALSGATNPSLTITNAQLSDQGNYAVTISNAYGATTASTSARLAIVEPPVITTQPQSQLVAVGGNVSFSVAASGPPSSYIWYHSSTLVAGATDAVLSITNAQASDGGYYEVVVGNGAGQVRSDPAYLTVGTPVPPTFTTQPANSQVRVGGSFVEYANASGSMPIYFQWYHDGLAVPGATDSVLRVENLQLADDGGYSLTATNMAGSATSRSAYVHILKPTVITAQPQSGSVSAGGTATFTVAATGDGNLSYNWGFTSANPGSPRGTWRTDGPLLTIDGAQKGDEGTYWVVVYGADTVTSAAATLTVTDAGPVITRAMSDQPVYVGGYATFAPGVSGTAPLSYQWTKDGLAIDGATNAVLTIDPVAATDGGSYAIQITNALGAITSAPATLTVSVPPPFAGGSGTPSDPYQIATVAQLGAVRVGLSKSYVLTADIDLNGVSFAPLGDSVNTFTYQSYHPFSGMFDGRGHTISNWSYAAPEGAAVGFFGTIGGSVTNLNIAHATVSGSNGGILADTNYGSVVNCSASGSLTTVAPRDSRTRSFGLLLGESDGHLAGCSSSGSIVANTRVDNLGGLVGTTNSDAGGIVGCHSDVTITASMSASYGTYGGLIGNHYGAMSDCYATGNLTVPAPALAGGLLGTNGGEAAIARCYATGNVTVTGTAGEVCAGGLIGYEDSGPVTNCFARGNVSSASTDGRTFNGTGGLVGSNGTSSSSIDHCYATGAVSAPTGFAGGLVGDPSFGPITDSYWDITNSGQTTSGQVASGAGAGLGKTIAEMQQQSTFADWDFAATWRISPGSYSTLRSIYAGSVVPALVVAPAGGFTLTVNGLGFTTGSTVLWNGVARPTTVVSDTRVTAAIPASDTSAVTDIATVFISVRNDLGDTSNPVVLTITTSNVAAVQTDTSSVGTTTIVSTAPTVSDGTGVSATLANNTDGTGTAVISAVTYNSNPTSAPSFDVGSGYVDLQVVGADPTDQVSANFYYASTITGTTEDALVLQYFDGAAWQPVLSSGGIAPAKDITDNLDNTISGGRFIVVFDNTSTPQVTNLSGTVFALALPAAGKKNEDRKKPEITTQPDDVTIVAGGDASFTVAAKSTSAMTYQWHFEAKKSGDIAGATSSTLVLHHVSAADAGTYTVTVTNANGSTTTKKATLTVLPAPPTITAQPQSQTVSSGSAVTFTVAASGEGSLAYQWQLNGKALGGQKSLTLALKTVAQKDSGNYACIVSNAGGSTQSDVATLTVAAPAVDLTAPGSVTAGNKSFTLTLTGSNFVSGDVVRWGGEDLATEFLSPTTLKATVPNNEAPPSKTSSTVAITVRAPGGDTSNPVVVTILPNK